MLQLIYRYHASRITDAHEEQIETTKREREREKVRESQSVYITAHIEYDGTPNITNRHATTTTTSTTTMSCDRCATAVPRPPSPQQDTEQSCPLQSTFYSTSIRNDCYDSHVIYHCHVSHSMEYSNMGGRPCQTILIIIIIITNRDAIHTTPPPPPSTEITHHPTIIHDQTSILQCQIITSS